MSERWTDMRRLLTERRARSEDRDRREAMGLTYVGVWYPQVWPRLPLELFVDRAGRKYVKEGPGDYRLLMGRELEG